MPELQTLLTDLVIGESPRWHEDRLWFSEWGTQEVVAVDLGSKSEVTIRMPTMPFCIDWLPEDACWLSRGMRDFSSAGNPMGRW